MGLTPSSSTAEITNQPNVVMQYLNYERDIVLRHGVILEGWTHSTWANPSELSTSLEPLRKFVGALQDGTCKFRKLSREECQKRQEEYDRKVSKSEIQVQERQKRKDTGKKRKVTEDSVPDTDTEVARPTQKQKTGPACG